MENGKRGGHASFSSFPQDYIIFFLYFHAHGGGDTPKVLKNMGLRKEKKIERMNQEEERERKNGVFVHVMRNVLWSMPFEFGMIWYPKCGCTMLRELFLRIHQELMPMMEEKLEGATIHNLHAWRCFYRNDLVPYHEVLFVVRSPFERVLSTFYNKHVIKKDIRYRQSHNFQKFRTFLSMRDLRYTFSNYLFFLEEEHSIDVHDLPLYLQTPLDRLGWESLETPSPQKVQDMVYAPLERHILHLSEDSSFSDQLSQLVKTMIRAKMEISEEEMGFVDEIIRSFPNTTRKSKISPHFIKARSHEIGHWEVTVFQDFLETYGYLPEYPYFWRDLSLNRRILLLYGKDLALFHPEKQTRFFTK